MQLTFQATTMTSDFLEAGPVCLHMIEESTTNESRVVDPFAGTSQILAVVSDDLQV